MAHVADTEFTGTPFNPRTAPLNVLQRWTAWDRYHVVDVYSDVDAELRSIREGVAVIDMSPLAKYDVCGPDAERYVNWVVTRDVSAMEDRQLMYTAWCDQDGKVVSDGMVLRIAAGHFRITGDPCSSWLASQLDGFEVELSDVTHDRGLLSVQGPRSKGVMANLFGPSWEGLRFSRMNAVEIGGRRVELSRQGFTGEHGYELCVDRSDGPAVWDAVLHAAEPDGIRPAGFVAADIARIEAGLVIPGPDYTKGGLSDDERGAAVEVDRANLASPYEIGAGRFVDLDGADFVGRDALVAERKAPPARQMVGLLLDWTAIAALFTDQGLPPVVLPTPDWYPKPVVVDGRPIGRATSLTWSPARRSVAGFGFLEASFCRPGTDVEVEFDVHQRTGHVAATVVELPHLPRRRAE